MTQTTSIVIVARKCEVFEFLGHALTERGHEVRMFQDDSRLQKIRMLRPKLVVLEAEGLTDNVQVVCARLRSWKNYRSARIAVICPECWESTDLGMFLGANLILERPLHPRSTLAKLDGLLHGKRLIDAAQVIEFDGLTLDPYSYQAKQFGRPLDLNLREFLLLYFLASHPNALWDRGQLLSIAWKESRFALRRVDEGIRRLRTLVEKDPEDPLLLRGQSDRGYGLYLSLGSNIVAPGVGGPSPIVASLDGRE